MDRTLKSFDQLKDLAEGSLGDSLNCTWHCRTVGLERRIPMSSEAHRTARIEARIAPAELAVVRRAAELQGRTLSDFIVAAARDAAHRTIEEAHLIRLTVEDQRRFVELLLDPPAPAPALERAKRAHAKLIRETR